MGLYYARAFHESLWYIDGKIKEPHARFGALNGRAITLDLKCDDGDWSVYEWDGQDGKALDLIAAVCYLKLSLDEIPGIDLFLISEQEFKSLKLRIKPEEIKPSIKEVVHRNLRRDCDGENLDICGENIVSLSLLILDSQGVEQKIKNYTTEDIFKICFANKEKILLAYEPSSRTKRKRESLEGKYRTLFTKQCEDAGIQVQDMLPPV